MTDVIHVGVLCTKIGPGPEHSNRWYDPCSDWTFLCPSVDITGKYMPKFFAWFLLKCAIMNRRALFVAVEVSVNQCRV